MEPLTSLSQLERALAQSRVLLYKHSPICGLSTLTRRQIDAFVELFPDAPVYVVDVIGERFISKELETRLGVRHASPQVILVEGGKAVRNASHRAIRSATLASWWSNEATRG